MEYILIDTNMIIYREGEHTLEKNVQTLTRLLLDTSDYKLCIHPLSYEELSKHKDKQQRETILSKISIYKKLESPPKRTKVFGLKCGVENKRNDYIDNCILYAIERNCAKYLITNDKGIHRKANKVGLGDRVLTIDQGIEQLSEDIDDSIIKTPAIIKEEFLYNLDIKDTFFDSLREDYYKFDNWLAKKQREHQKAHITYLDEGTNKLGSFLMLKEESKTELYEDFDKPFEANKRVKVSTFKVADNGKSIGEAFIKIIVDYALNRNLKEIYVTAFDKQGRLISMLQEYGFHFYTYKNTKKANETVGKEGVYLKKIVRGITEYPMINATNQGKYLIPIQSDFSEMLFPYTFDIHQLSIMDIKGTSTYSNAIKKVYISRSKIKTINNGDIIVFYVSQIRKVISCVGVVDEVFRSKDITDYESFEKIVKRRTIYQKEYLKKAYESNYLVILFKYYMNLPKHIPLQLAVSNGIIKSAPQSIQSLDNLKFKKIIDLSGSETQIEI